MSAERQIVPQTNAELVKKSEAHDLAAAGQIANQTASDYLFADYQQRRARRTTQTQLAALVLWVDYLQEVGAAATLISSARQWAQEVLSPAEQEHYAAYAAEQQQSLPIIYGALYSQQIPIAWQGVTWGLVEGFVKWLLNAGYSIASVNNRLSAVKVYIRLATKAGVIPPTEQALIREVKGYGLTEGKRVDAVRPRTRVGHKKEEALVLTAEQARVRGQKKGIEEQRDNLKPGEVIYYADEFNVSWQPTLKAM